MSKQKKPKAAARKAVKKRAATPARRRRTIARSDAPAGGPRTVTATILIFSAGGTTTIRTTPQRIYANPGDRVQWSAVNLIDGSEPEVTVSFPRGGPFADREIRFRGLDHRRVPAAAAGQFKYDVSALGATEDPEIEIPEM